MKINQAFKENCTVFYV